MDPKMCTSLNFANTFKIAMKSRYTVNGMKLYIQIQLQLRDKRARIPLRHRDPQVVDYVLAIENDYYV